MSFFETMLFYFTIGVGIAVSLYLSPTERFRVDRWFAISTSIFFWPLYLPILLSSRKDPPASTVKQTGELDDDLAAVIMQVEAELDRALGSLDGWAEVVFARENDRLDELRSVWRMQAERIREMDRLLAQPGFDESTLASIPSTSIGTDRVQRSEAARRDNVERLRRVRKQAYDELMGMVAWVRELVTMIHLAKFSGAPASRAEELVAQIAAVVEGLSEVSTWQAVPAGGTDER
ncbi:MAG: hypothetical protein U1D30_22250 [Planctomycetota bacterium]